MKKQKITSLPKTRSFAQKICVKKKNSVLLRFYNKPNMKSFFAKYYGVILIIPLCIFIFGFRVIIRDIEAFEEIRGIIFPCTTSKIMTLNTMLHTANIRLILSLIIAITFLTTTYLYFKSYAKVFMFLFLVVSFVNTHLFITSMSLFAKISLTKDNVPNIDEALDLMAAFVFIPLEILTLLLFAYLFDLAKNNSIASNKK